MKTLDYLLTTHVYFRRIFILISLLLIGWLDLATGFEYSITVFYLMPVSIAAWYEPTRIALSAVILSGLIWLYSDFHTGHIYSSPIIPYWNAGVRVISFAIVAFLLIRVKTVLAEMTCMAMKDSLTGLNNFRSFEIQYEIAYRQRSKEQQSAICVIDLDGFKQVNDRLGHSQGDEVLIRFARVLQKSVSSADIVARMGGDEFVVLLNDTNQQAVDTYEGHLRQLFSRTEMKRDFGVDFSMGISLFYELPHKPDDAKHHADGLMYQSKDLGKATTTVKSVEV